MGFKSPTRQSLYVLLLIWRPASHRTDSELLNGALVAVGTFGTEIIERSRDGDGIGLFTLYFYRHQLMFRRTKLNTTIYARDEKCLDGKAVATSVKLVFVRMNEFFDFL